MARTQQQQPASQAKHYSPAWMRLWFLISTIVVFWDAGFCLMRPRSFKGGDLQWIWWPYALYEHIDLIYSPGFYSANFPNGFTSAQAILNLVENCLNIAYLVSSSMNSPVAILYGFIGVLFTLWKTVLYWLQDQQCGWCLTGHNSTRDWWLLFALPNGLWIIVPAVIAAIFARELAAGLRQGAKAKVL